MFLEASKHRETGDDLTVDVAIVGFGPVGQALTGLLGRLGHDVVAVERWPTVFPLPRAGHVDDEVMRILQALSVAEEIDEDSLRISTTEFHDRHGEVLASLDWGHEGISGWYSDYSMFQPYLESLLEERAMRRPNVELARGWQAEGLEQDEDSITVVLRDGVAQDGTWLPGDQVRELHARYVVGCDGANSVVREHSRLEMHDFGFEADWLVVFAEPNQPESTVDMPDAAQLLDPERPTTAIRASGKRFRRWEFMLMPGEHPESMSTPDVAWKLIAPWGFTPDNARLIRHTVFRFRSLVANRWRAGRALIAGDAAHQMPPFLGQGLCSGLRDVISLAWKLDLVLRGISSPTLLDHYQRERRPHAEAIVQASLRVGEIVSVTDPEQATRRDHALRSGTLAPPDPMPPLTDGILLRDGDGGLLAPAGALSMQPRLRRGDEHGLLDDLIGHGWAVLATGFDPLADLGPQARELLRILDARTLRVDSDTIHDEVAFDDDGSFLAWLGQLGVNAVIVRPDFYLFAGVNGAAELDAALADLRQQLAPAAIADSTVSPVSHG